MAQSEFSGLSLWPPTAAPSHFLPIAVPLQHPLVSAQKGQFCFLIQQLLPERKMDKKITLWQHQSLDKMEKVPIKLFIITDSQVLAEEDINLASPSWVHNRWSYATQVWMEDLGKLVSRIQMIIWPKNVYFHTYFKIQEDSLELGEFCTPKFLWIGIFSYSHYP